MGAAGPAGRSIRRFVWFWRALFAQANRPFQLLSLPVNWRRNRNPEQWQKVQTCNLAVWRADVDRVDGFDNRSEEHTSELQSLMRISYAVFCLKKTKRHKSSIHKT